MWYSSLMYIRIASANHEVRPKGERVVISACDTLMKNTAYIFKMADKNKTLQMYWRSN